jgi:small subunit ribosomal protein S1
LSIDPERERISLGIKQLENENAQLSAHPFDNYTKDQWVKGKVRAIESDGVKVDLGNNVEAEIKTSELGDEGKTLEVGQEIEARILEIDRKNHILSLSLSPLEEKSSI